MKEQKTFILDPEVIKKIKEEAREQRRSDSFILNEILKNHYEVFLDG